MHKVGLITERTGSDAILKALEGLESAGDIQILTATSFRSTDTFDQAAWKLINSVDLVVAVVVTASPGMLYEIGLAHGAGKPVVIVDDGAKMLPAALASQRVVRVNRRLESMAAMMFQLRQVIDEAVRQPAGYLGPRAQSEQATRWAQVDWKESHGELESNPLAFSKAHSKDLEGWFAGLARQVPGWDVIQSDRQSEGGFDLAVWNSREDAELLALGNPIAVEITRQATVSSVSRLINAAKRSGLSGLIFATASHFSARDKRSILRDAARGGLRAILLDGEDLSSIENSKEFLGLVKRLARESLYDEGA